MAMRFVNGVVSRSSLGRFTMWDGLTLSCSRCFSTDSGKGGVLDDKERAQEAVYIQKMERERLQKLKMDKDSVEKGKEAAEKTVGIVLDLGINHIAPTKANYTNTTSQQSYQSSPSSYQSSPTIKGR